LPSPIANLASRPFQQEAVLFRWPFAIALDAIASTTLAFLKTGDFFVIRCSTRSDSDLELLFRVFLEVRTVVSARSQGFCRFAVN
jgi:hypothetical protein